LGEMITFIQSRIQERPEARREEDAVEFVRKRLGFEPDEKQTLVLRSEAKRGILNCSRQWGKSTVGAAKAVHRAYTEAEQTVLVASPSLRQSGEFLRKAVGMARQLGVAVRGDGYNARSLLFPNGSRIVALPAAEGRVRGFSAVSLVVVDEAARVPDSLYQALRPMLARSDGDLWMMSTPWGKQGFFYESWVNGGDEWERVQATALECAGISAAFLEEERRQKGGTLFRQEYMCEFCGLGGSLFDGGMVDDAVSGDVDALLLTFDR
jgi:hypothetical protein